MIQYFSSQGGGSGASLNYSVVGLAGIDPPPGKENRIWVNTDQEITGHIFSVEAPSNPTKGLVWFATGSESIVSFSATQKNPIMVYPQLCQQFNGTDWVTKVAKSYIGGDWQDWTVILFKNGNAHEEITGGYEGRAISIDGANYTTTPSFNEDNDGKTSQLESWDKQTSGVIITKRKINLTIFHQIQFDITFIQNVNGGAFVYVTQNADTIPSQEERVYVTVPQTKYLDISNLTGDWYIAIGLRTDNIQGTNPGKVQAQVNSITMS